MIPVPSATCIATFDFEKCKMWRPATVCSGIHPLKGPTVVMNRGVTRALHPLSSVVMLVPGAGRYGRHRQSQFQRGTSLQTSDNLTAPAGHEGIKVFCEWTINEKCSPCLHVPLVTLLTFIHVTLLQMQLCLSPPYIHAGSGGVSGRFCIYSLHLLLLLK